MEPVDLILAQERTDRLVGFLIRFLVELSHLLEPLLALKALQRFAAGRELLAGLVGNFLRLFDLCGVELLLLLDTRVGEQHADAAAKATAASSAAVRRMVRGRVQQKPHAGQVGFLTSSSISLRKSSSSSSFFLGLGLGPALKWSGTVSSNSACSAESRSIRVGAVLGLAARLGLASSVSRPASSISECRFRSS